MESPADRRIIDELLATNRELVVVNRKIAETLATLERPYSSRLEQNNVHMAQMTARFTHWLSPFSMMGPNLFLLLTLVMLAFLVFR